MGWHFEIPTSINLFFAPSKAVFSFLTFSGLGRSPLSIPFTIEKIGYTYKLKDDKGNVEILEDPDFTEEYEVALVCWATFHSFWKKNCNELVLSKPREDKKNGRRSRRANPKNPNRLVRRKGRSNQG